MNNVLTPPPRRKGPLSSPPPPRKKKITGKIEQVNLFDVPPDWKNEWRGMPEFEQDDLLPWQTIIVHFRNVEDRRGFSETIGQKITDETKTIWHPKQEIQTLKNKTWRSGKPSNAAEFSDIKKLPGEIEKKVIDYDACGDLL